MRNENGARKTKNICFDLQHLSPSCHIDTRYGINRTGLRKGQQAVVYTGRSRDLQFQNVLHIDALRRSSQLLYSTRCV